LHSFDLSCFTNKYKYNPPLSSFFTDHNDISVVFLVNAILADVFWLKLTNLTHIFVIFLGYSQRFVVYHNRLSFLGMAKIFAEYFGGKLNLSSTGEKTTMELIIIRDPALAAENLK
jgi:hypothetical protein